MITVIAGVNGAGKSSVVGSWLRGGGEEFFNPDEVARMLMQIEPDLSLDEANGKAWRMGYDRLEAAIEKDKTYTFETTLGGNSICDLLHQACAKGVHVRIVFCGLNSPELHVQRVAERVASGGHDIPEEKIRQRWIGTINNMMSLIPVCGAVTVYDNSADLVKRKPAPIRLFAMTGNEFIQPPIENMPDWAKPLAVVAIKRNIDR